MFQIKRYPLSIVCICLIWFLSFFTPPKTDLDNVPFMDKWVHMVMYGGTTLVIWSEYWWRHRKADFSWSKILTLGGICLIIMSGIIELLQEYCTPNPIITANRSGDWMDLAANATGVIVVTCVFSVIRLIRK